MTIVSGSISNNKKSNDKNINDGKGPGQHGGAVLSTITSHL